MVRGGELGRIYVNDDVARVLVVSFKGLDGRVDGGFAGFEGAVAGEGDANQRFPGQARE